MKTTIDAMKGAVEFLDKHPLAGESGTVSRRIILTLQEAIAREKAKTKSFKQLYVDNAAGIETERLAMTEEAQTVEQNKWRDAVLNALAVHSLDAPLSEPPDSILKRIIDMAVTIAKDPTINAPPVKPSLPEGVFVIARTALEAACRDRYPAWNNPRYFGEIAKELRRKEIAQEIADLGYKNTQLPSGDPTHKPSLSVERAALIESQHYLAEHGAN